MVALLGNSMVGMHDWHSLHFKSSHSKGDLILKSAGDELRPVGFLLNLVELRKV